MKSVLCFWSSSNYLSPFASSIAILLLCCIRKSSCQLLEEDRVAEYNKRNHKWPPLPDDYIPQTPGWRSLFERRLAQVATIPSSVSKYNGYMSTVHSALIAPNFTEFGWGLTRGPPDLVQALLDNLMRGLESENTPVEHYDHNVDSEYPMELPLMIPNEELNTRAMRELKPIQEAWSGVKLIGNNAYGLRVYRNQSNLQMHIDESTTHVISSILHVGHDPDGDPWPLVIEDLHGNTHEVFLETGDMLLYESSKCFHGRPKRYNGKWYSSLFTHYYPTDWDAEGVLLESHYRIPPGWDDIPEMIDEGLDELVVTETSFKEPGCEHEWCAMKNTAKWEMPPGLSVGQFVTTDGEIRTFNLDFSEGDEL